MNEQQILSNLIHVALFTNFDAGRKFNTAVVKLALEGENTFDTELLLDIVTATGFNPDVTKQREAVKFVIDSILAQRNVKKPRYVPVFTGDSKEWAIDKCGDAYFYEEITDHNDYNWHGLDMIYDTKFDKEEFPHMWENGAWKNSKIAK
jgi:hypothetical protein